MIKKVKDNNLYNINYETYNNDEIVMKYSGAVTNIGLWESEKYAISKYFDKRMKILDIACGAGRTTNAIYKLGYKDIVGIDFSEKMICAAKSFNSKISFLCCDMRSMPFNNESFDGVLASYNAIMMIPQKKQRIRAFKEISRVLSPNGIFIFTASDREYNPEYHKYWIKEKIKWIYTRLFKKREFGDAYFTEKGQSVFVHFATKKEIRKILINCDFNLLESFFRTDFKEKSEVQNFSGDTMFYIAKKNK